MKHADVPHGTWGKAILHAVFLMNRSPSSSTEVSPYQFRTGQPFNFEPLRVFGCPAQIFVRRTDRSNPKLSDRSEKGTFLGMSTKGNGYIFLVPRTRSIVEIDSKDVLFNETFSDCRDRQGKIIPNGAVLQPDLHDEPQMENSVPTDGIIASRISLPLSVSNRFAALDDDNDADTSNDAPTDPKSMSHEAPPSITDKPKPVLAQRPPAKAPSKFWTYEPVPNTDAPTASDRRNDGPKSQAFFQVIPSKRSTAQHNKPNPTASTVLTALLAQASDPYNPELDLLLSSLESGRPADLCLLSSYRTSELHSALEGVFYDGPDPKSQKDIDNMVPAQAKRYNDASIAEFNGMKKKKVMELLPRSQLPPNIVLYPSVVNWTTKKVLGVYSKTKCRICFGGHRYDKTYTDCFAPTVNFNSVLMVICFAAIFGWHLGSLDYS